MKPTQRCFDEQLCVSTFTFLTEKETTKAATNCLGQGFLVTPLIQRVLTRDMKFTEISVTTEEFLAQPQIENLDIKYAEFPFV